MVTLRNWYLNISSLMLMPVYCDNQATIFIIVNLTFHEQTKYIKIDCHYI
ncbi:unnamed protein product [Spirodela intermedia]|uniref:Uncharacterized protein n=1 Tax=Spirodela intermedia TaxID=51605 RepID=A0A7I8K7R6_SPIIN|nr:unnamed protein product [Spirodela intermedia]